MASPRSARAATEAAGRGPRCVADRHHPVSGAIPGAEEGRLAQGPGSVQLVRPAGGHRDTPTLHQSGRSHRDHGSIDSAFRAQAGECRDLPGFRRLHTPLQRAGFHRLTKRMGRSRPPRPQPSPGTRTGRTRPRPGSSVRSSGCRSCPAPPAPASPCARTPRQTGRLTPSSAPLPAPTAIAAGVARPRAQGQAMISTATAFRNAPSQSPVANSQPASVATAATTTAGTKMPDTRSARRWTGALVDRAFSDNPYHLGQDGAVTHLGDLDH